MERESTRDKMFFSSILYNVTASVDVQLEYQPLAFQKDQDTTH